MSSLRKKGKKKEIHEKKKELSVDTLMGPLGVPHSHEDRELTWRLSRNGQKAAGQTEGENAKNTQGYEM